MLKNILWMAGGLGLGLAIWAIYAQYKKAKDKKAAEAAAAALAEAATTATPAPGLTTQSGTVSNTAVTPVKA